MGKGEGEGGVEKETEGDGDGERKGETLKRCAHKATKHLGTCRARQVEIETKLPLSPPDWWVAWCEGFELGSIYIGALQYIDWAM